MHPKNLRLAVALMSSLAAVACGDSKPAEPAAAAPAEPKVDREQLLREAQARIEAEREKQRTAMREVGTATVKLKKITGADEKKKKAELAFAFENTSDKVLVQAEGDIIFRDAEGTALRKMKVPFREEIKPGKKATKRGKFPLDIVEDNDVKFAKTPLEELKIEWIPTLYRFEDGTEMRGE
ncbi:MAG: hypothetical protein PVI30_07770 [Myxococcales bacterium]|jgi:hypothetical protein